MRGEFLIFGHRGSPRRHAENTVDSFEAALASGADGFETDLRLLSDRTAVLFHDDDLDDAPIESLSAPEVDGRGVPVQRVADLARFAGRARMILEVKRGRWEAQVLASVAGWPDVVIASFDHTAIAEIKRQAPEAELGITIHGSLVDVADYAARLGVQWVYPNYRFVDEAMVRSLHERGIGVVPWTPNRVSDWDRLRSLGCDGIITDLPAEAVAWRALDAS
jgi:glycerophosphoryl diester phosphodiesterase